MPDFGDIIKKHRLQKQLTIQSLAQKCNPHISPAYISKMENNKDAPSPALLEQIASILGIDAEMLMAKVVTFKINQYKNYLLKKYSK